MTDNVFDFGSDVVESQEKIGGYSLLPSDIYKLKINQAYLIKSKNGATGVVLDMVSAEGHKHTETFYITNAKGEPYYMRDGKKNMLPSMQMINNLCKLVGLESFSNVYTQRMKKAGTVFDWESRKEITKELDMLIKLCGKVVSVAMVHRKENKNKKVGSEYVATNESRESNAVLAFLAKTDNRTAQETAEGKDAKYAVDFLAKFQGKLDDRFKPVQVDYATSEMMDPLATSTQTEEDFI